MESTTVSLIFFSFVSNSTPGRKGDVVSSNLQEIMSYVQYKSLQTKFVPQPQYLEKIG